MLQARSALFAAYPDSIPASHDTVIRCTGWWRIGFPLANAGFRFQRPVFASSARP